jgi:hypothetical protein
MGIHTKSSFCKFSRLHEPYNMVLCYFFSYCYYIDETYFWFFDLLMMQIANTLTIIGLQVISLKNDKECRWDIG